MYCFSTMEEFSRLRESVRQKLVQLLDNGVEPLFVAVNEAVNNAILHGNKQDKTKKVYLTITSSPNEIKVIIRDEGRGFKPVKQQETEENDLRESGRGLAIIGVCVDRYYFTVQPSEIVLIKNVTLSPARGKEKAVRRGRLANAHQYQYYQ